MSHVYDFRTTRRYHGPLQAVIFDWAGTLVDFGCIATAEGLVEVFQRHQVDLSLAEARGPMGLEKQDHIRHLTRLEAVRDRWQARHGRAPTDQDVTALYQAFIPLQLACLARHAQLIPGTLEVVEQLRDRDIAIGTTTSYSHEMAAIHLREAEHQGFAPDAAVSVSEVPRGRPYPAMCLQNTIRLGVETVAACVKVDDTVPGIHAGLNAGMWTIGLTVSGNAVGLGPAQWQALSTAEQDGRRDRAFATMNASGAHYVVDSIADILPCLDDIELRLRRGEKP